MDVVSFRTTDIVNLFMVDKLVVFFGSVSPNGNRNLPDEPEQHDHYEIYYIDKGFLTLKLDGEAVTVRAGQCLLVAPFVVHQQVDKAVGTILKFGGFVCRGNLLLPLCQKPFPLNEDERTLLCDLVDDGSQCFERLPKQSNEIGYRVLPGVSRGRLQALKNKLEIFLIKHIESRMGSKTPPGRSSPADAVYHYLTEHITDRVTITQIAENLSLSTSYIKQEFSKKYGRGIIDCLLDMKIDRAKKLIEETPLNFTQIADYLSFESENHLLKTFLKRTGMTPSAYLKEVQNHE